MKIPKLVEVTWVDSRSPVAGWSFLQGADFPSVCHCLSVGYLVKSTREEAILAQSLADAGGSEMQVNGLMAIPKRCVVAIRPLPQS
jgi:hypothetical protein